MSLSANIRMFRKKAGLTQIELADKLGVSIATLRRWEAGETAPTGTKIFELAEQLGISPDLIVASRNNSSDAPEQPQIYNDNRENGNGMLVFEGGGTRIELPPTDRGYELFDKLINNLIKDTN